MTSEKVEAKAPEQKTPEHTGRSATPPLPEDRTKPTDVVMAVTSVVAVIVSIVGVVIAALTFMTPEKTMPLVEVSLPPGSGSVQIAGGPKHVEVGAAGPVAGPASTSPQPEPRSQPQGTLPVYCQNSYLKKLVEELSPVAARAKVSVCKNGECGQPALHVGDKIQLSVISPVSGAIIAMDVDESGDTTQLLPNERPSGNAEIAADQLHAIPEAGFAIEASKVGRGCVVVVIGPRQSKWGSVVQANATRMRGLRVTDATPRDLVQVVASEPALLAGYAVAWTTYEITK